MALMIPENVEQFTTVGEEQVYNFLASVAKPDSDYIVWYSPDIRGREPDFILYNNEIGLIIFEVKDWSLEQILEANRKEFRLFLNGKEETRKNPMKQAKEYFFACMDAIKKDGHLLSVEQGNPRVPISCGVIFPNINKMEFQEKALEAVVELDKTFFWDDMHPESPQVQDATGIIFQNILLNKFEPCFPCQLTGKEKIHLKQVIFPVVRIEQPREQQGAEFSAFETRISSLDHHQESLARKYDGGHRILKGPSGCGKTLILIHKALFLLRYNPSIKSILFVCFNIMLVRYIKRMLTEKNIPVGKNGVEVMHFYELCNCITGDKVDFEGQDQDYYQIIIDDALAASKDKATYDAILVDEAQDFSDDMFHVIINLLNPATDILTIALDENQNIYSKSRNWKDLGINARGRTHSIKYIYRSTKELTEFATRFSFQTEGKISEQTKAKQKELFPGFFDYHGPKPFIFRYKNIAQLLANIADEINLLVKEKHYPLSEIAILYTKSSIPGQN